MPLSPTTTWRIGAAVGVAALAALFWEKQVRYDVIPKRFHVVAEDQLYRSGKLTPAAFRKVVEENDIRTIIDLGAWEPGTSEETLAAATAAELGVDRVVLDLEGDATGDPTNYVQALRIITDPERQPVLVHCGAGTERTGCIVMLYRNLVEDVPLDEAYREARRIGHDPGRNKRFQPYLDQWFEPISDAYRQGRDIVPGWQPPIDTSGARGDDQRP